MKPTPWIIIALLVVSCGPASKLRRAEKLISKAEELGAKWRVDSVQIEVPIIIPETRVDSVFVQKPGDTVTITKERLKVKIMRWGMDTVRIEAECAADTVYRKVTKTVTKTIEAKGKIRWYHLGVAFLIGAVIGRFVIRLLV